MARRSRSKPIAKPAQNPAQVAQGSAPQIQSISATANIQTFQGPIPPPALLQQYNAIVPNAAERIIAMAEKENQHRHAQETQALQANIDAQRKQLELAETQTKATFRSDACGQFLGFLVSGGCIGGCIFLAMNGQPWVAATLAGLPLAGIIRALKEKPKAPQK